MALLTANASAQYGNTPTLHTDGRYLKDQHGNRVPLHGVSDTPNPYFNGNRWGSSCSSATTASCISYFDKMATALTDTTQGAFCNLLRLHLDPCWTNTAGATTTGEDDISAFSSDNLKAYLQSLFFPIAQKANRHGLYVTLRAPGLCPQQMKAGDAYQTYLKTVWNIVSANDSVKRNARYLSLEVANGPKVILDANGQASAQAPRDYFQPIVDLIRKNGFTGIIWIPCPENQHSCYEQYPISGYNIGYATHAYPGNYGNTEVNCTDDNFITNWDTCVPVTASAPLLINEFDWDTQTNGTASKWGNAFKQMVDHYGNISLSLAGIGQLIDIDAYLNSGKVTAANSQDAEACGVTCLKWYADYAKSNCPHPDFTKQWCADNGNGTYTNPIINADFPDPDIIRVGDTYYLATTTMFYFPGITILKSKDLVNWEYCANPLLQINTTDAYNLLNGSNHYSKGQWAPSLKYHNGLFYINFIAFGDDGGDFLLTATDPEGTWTKKKLNGFYYDSGLMFDDGANGDGGIYIVSGINTLTVTKLDSNFNAVSSKVVVSKDNAGLEGSHMYHIGNYYYIYSTYGGTEGSQTIFRSSSPMGSYEEHDGRVFSGEWIHQGGLVETQTGEWWTILFHDAGPIGRIPYLEPVVWNNGWPTIGNNGKDVVTHAKPNVGSSYPQLSLNSNETFCSQTLNKQWEWNHNPDNSKWSLSENPGYLRLHTAVVTSDFKQARNTLSQRAIGYSPAGTLWYQYADTYGTCKMEIGNMHEGDVAGLCVFQDPYAYIGVKMENGTKKVVYYNSKTGTSTDVTTLAGNVGTIYLRAIANFGSKNATFSYSTDNKTYTKVDGTLAMAFNLSIFVGNRFCLFNYATKATGGYVDVDWFSTEPNFEESKFYDKSQLQSYTEQQMTLSSLTMVSRNLHLNVQSDFDLTLTATYEAGNTANVAADCKYEISDPSIISISNGKLTTLKEGICQVTATCTDGMGRTSSLHFTVTVETFPLTNDAVNPSIYGTGQFNETTGVLTTSKYGFGGWHYASGLDLSSYDRIVVKLKKASNCGASFRLFDGSSYWSTPFMHEVGSDTLFSIDLHQMSKGDSSLCNPANIYYVGFWSYGGDIAIEKVYLQKAGETSIVPVAATMGTYVTATRYFSVSGIRSTHPSRGVNVVEQTMSDGSVRRFKMVKN
jgi:beta-xylosidase